MIRCALVVGAATCIAILSAASEPTVRVSVHGRVTRMDLDDYVARVVAGEGQPQASEAAQQALAITVRTYALANLNRHRRQGYDLCDTTHCQVLRSSTDASRRAATITAGRVLLQQGRPASVYYSALCGGHSELASQVWPGADDSTSHLHEDDACRDEPAWQSEIDADDIEDALRAAGHRGQRLRDLRVLQRNASGRVTRLRVDGFTPNEVSGQDFRSAMAREVGYREFKSTAFEVRRAGSKYRFTGTGFGHGVGLCVIGAGRRAVQGATADAILRFYFPNLNVATLSSRAAAAAASPSAKPVAPPPRVAMTEVAKPVREDVLVTVGASETSDRARVAELTRTARDRIARAAGVSAPPELRVIVHATVDAFMRATGEPWWASGATEGVQIDLPPLAILRQRGQLERAVQREVAHALLDPSLLRKPLWVREGAASYFADAKASDAAVRGRCPADEELLQPISAGAYRSALARAEACFARQISRGRKWNDVR